MIQHLKNLFWHLPKAIFYDYYYHHPSRHLTLIGITGTDGKTTTATLIHHTLGEMGIKAGLFSTIGAKIGSDHIRLGLHTTSPDPSIVQKIFHQMVGQGITHVVVEVTAHAIDQYRFHGCHFQVAAITNTSHEHLDYFSSMAKYVLAKSKIFKQSTIRILNLDDPSFSTISKSLGQPFVRYSQKHKSEYQARQIQLNRTTLTFTLNHSKIITDSRYLYQVNNILVAYAILDQLKLNTSTLLTTLKHFPLVNGRREEVPNDHGINCIVDFAHTPNALEQTLKSLTPRADHKLIVIFGATGGRDQSKRPLMGKIVSKYADIAIITADDTRHEKIEIINQQIISGIDRHRLDQNKFKYYDVHNRQEAFNLAIKLATPGDIVIACGKGHEKTILHKDTEYPWSETEAFRSAFRQNNL